MISKDERIKELESQLTFAHNVIAGLNEMLKGGGMINEIRRRYYAGQTGIEIANALGVSRTWVYRLMKVNGVEVRPATHRNRRPDIKTKDVLTLYDAGVSFEAIGRALGCSTTCARKRVLDSGRTPRPRNLGPRRVKKDELKSVLH